MRALLLLTLLPLGACDRDPCDRSGTICTYAGSGLPGLGAEAVPATESHLYLPQDLTFGPDGQPYILDWNNHRIRTIDAEGLIHTVAGNGLLGDGPQGDALSAAFNHPTHINFDGSGRMLIAAWHNSRIERVNLTDGTLEFICGTGQRGYNGDGIPATEAILDLPASVVIDNAGNTYIADQANQQIRMVDGDDILWDVAGQQRVVGYAGDGGPASEALFHASQGQAADPANRMLLHDNQIFLTDTGNHVIRVIDLDTWVVDTFAGARECDASGACVSEPGYDGDGGDAQDAQFYNPTDLAIGLDGEMYVADTYNHCVRVIDPDGTVSTFAGECGVPGYAGDEGPVEESLLYRPYGVSLDPAGNVYIADTYNQVFRRVAR